METITGWFYSVPPIPSIPSAVAGKFFGLDKFLADTCLFFYADGFKDGAVAGVVACCLAMVAYWWLKVGK